MFSCANLEAGNELFRWKMILSYDYVFSPGYTYMSSSVGAGNFKETCQKTCDYVLKTGSAGCCYIREWDCCETKDEVLILVALVILASAYTCLIKLDFHPPDCSFSLSSTFCSSHSSQAVYDSNGNVVEGGKSRIKHYRNWSPVSQLANWAGKR